jgi:uncharacterized protein
MADHHHHISFIELPVTDMAAAKRFYSTAFGWTFIDHGDDYADIQGAGLAGGLCRSAVPPARGGALVILYSTDLEASERAIERAGSAVLERHQFPGGRRFHFLDVSGNELAVWTAA